MRTVQVQILNTGSLVLVILLHLGLGCLTIFEPFRIYSRTYENYLYGPKVLLPYVSYGILTLIFTGLPVTWSQIHVRDMGCLKNKESYSELSPSRGLGD